MGRTERVSNVPARLEAAVRTVLAAHGFPPPRLLAGPGGVTWAVSPRPASTGRLELAVVKLTVQGRAEVRFVDYARVGADWAVLGRLFRGSSESEAAQMEKEIARTARGEKP